MADNEYINVTDGMLASYYGRLQGLLADKKEVDQEIADLKTEAKDNGVCVKTLLDLIKQSKKEPHEVRHAFNKMVAAGKILLPSVYKGASFLASADADISSMTEAQRRIHWHEQGWDASSRGAGRDTCPHLPETDAARYWFEGYQDQQKAQLSNIKSLDDVPPTSALDQAIDGALERIVDHVTREEPIGDVAGKVVDMAARKKAAKPKGPPKPPKAKTPPRPPATH